MSRSGFEPELASLDLKRDMSTLAPHHAQKHPRSLTNCPGGVTELGLRLRCFWVSALHGCPRRGQASPLLSDQGNLWCMSALNCPEALGVAGAGMSPHQEAPFFSELHGAECSPWSYEAPSSAAWVTSRALGQAWTLGPLCAWQQDAGVLPALASELQG